MSVGCVDVGWLRMTMSGIDRDYLVAPCVAIPTRHQLIRPSLFYSCPATCGDIRMMMINIVAFVYCCVCLPLFVY